MGTVGDYENYRYNQPTAHGPGQAVVIPAGWWHEVDNDPNTLAFAFDLVHA